ncbi:hypothetical protein M758_11G085000 [Ceratodon purpureus]|nr:hypothetical protein M758_11G085000 [Ceratodon purpureus]
MGTAVKSDAAVGSKGWEPRPRGFLSLSVRGAIFGVFLLCACIIVLIYDVRYAQFLLRPGKEYQDFAQAPRVIDAPLHLPLQPYHNATDELILDAEIDDDPTSVQTEDEAHSDMDLGVEENDKDDVEELEDSDLVATNTSNLITEKTSTGILNSNANVQDIIFVSDAEEIKPNGLNDSSTRDKKEWDIPRAIPKYWKPSKKCATAEEMGAETVGNTRAASLRVRAMIRDFIAEHGAEKVGSLPGAEFCQRGFVLGQAQEDGFGNNMYKVLTAAGLAVMLNRSLIIGERGGTNPTYLYRKDMRKPAFGDYLDFSSQAFTVREVRRLWAVNKCATKYKRPLIIHNESMERGFRCTRCTCDDWTTLTVPILQFKGTIGAGAIQLLLKNEHPAMRRAAAKLLGNPAIPSSRPNTFGELFRAFIAPNAGIKAAVQWALKGGPDPDITLHLRMLHSRTRPGPAAAATCINRIRRILNPSQLSSARRPRVVVVTDTPAIIPELQKSLGQTVEVIHFNYLAFAKQKTNRSEIFNLNYGMPAHNRLRDWGAMPRWVAMVDFFLAARARTAVISGAYRRVSTTYAQFVAALASANTLDEEDPSRPACVYYSSLQSPLLTSGLASQSGWGHTWRPFGGKLGCRNQPTQCAQTALMPYAWWDAPWQSPISADLRKMRSLTGLDAMGQVSERAMDQYCTAARRKPVVRMKLQVPSYDEAIAKGT